MDYKNFTGKMGSKDYLKFALLSLMEEKSIYKITVKELCDRAMINRSTFYDNYENLDDFFDHVIKDVAYGLVRDIDKGRELADMLTDKEVAKSRYTRWYQHVHDHYDEFRLLMGDNGTPVFRDFLIKQGLEWYTQLLAPIMSRYKNTISLDILVNYIIGAHMGLLEYYVNSEMKYSVEYMSDQMVNITMAGPYSLLNLYDE